MNTPVITVVASTSVAIRVFLSLYIEHSGETHEGHGDDAGDQHDYPGSAQWGWHVGITHLLAQPRHQRYGQSPAQPRTQSIKSRLHEVILTNHHEKSRAQDGAVHRNQGQEYAQRIIQARAEPLHEHLDELNECRDNGDEDHE